MFWIRSEFSFWVPKLIVWIYKSVLVHKLHANLKSRWKTICKELYLSVQFIFSRTGIRWTFVPYFTHFFQLQDTSLRVCTATIGLLKEPNTRSLLTVGSPAILTDLNAKRLKIAASASSSFVNCFPGNLLYKSISCWLIQYKCTKVFF